MSYIEDLSITDFMRSHTEDIDYWEIVILVLSGLKCLLFWACLYNSINCCCLFFVIFPALLLLWAAELHRRCFIPEPCWLLEFYFSLIFFCWRGDFDDFYFLFVKGEVLRLLILGFKYEVSVIFGLVYFFYLRANLSKSFR